MDVDDQSGSIVIPVQGCRRHCLYRLPARRRCRATIPSPNAANTVRCGSGTVELNENADNVPYTCS